MKDGGPLRLMRAADRVVQSVRQRLSRAKPPWGVPASESPDPKRRAKALVAQLADPAAPPRILRASPFS